MKIEKKSFAKQFVGDLKSDFHEGLKPYIRSIAMSIFMVIFLFVLSWVTAKFSNMGGDALLYFIFYVGFAFFALFENVRIRKKRIAELELEAKNYG